MSKHGYRKPVSPTAHRPQVSFLLATYNRRSVVEHTIARLRDCGLAACDSEIIAVDNASTDGTPEAIAGHVDHLVRLPYNAGSCAKARGLAAARGQFVVFVDDDSHPRPGAIERMLAHFSDNPQLGAAGFAVHLPDGNEESAALPGVFVGCGVGFRADALGAVGGLDPTFFMQAEEYDLSFRLASRGWEVRIFRDLAVNHLKTPTARRHARTTFYDTRNNLRVVARYLPPAPARVYTGETLLRYRWIAGILGHERAFRTGAAAGLLPARHERQRFHRFRLDARAFESFFQWDAVARRMKALRADGVRQILLADLGKNIYPYVRGAAAAGISILGIADDRFTAPRRRYRGLPVLPLATALDRAPDAIVVSNMSEVHARASTLRLRAALQGLPTAATPSLHAWYAAPDENSRNAESAPIPLGKNRSASDIR